MDHLWYDDPASGKVLCQNCRKTRTSKNQNTECVPFKLSPAPDLSADN